MRRIELILHNNLSFIPVDSYLHQFTHQPTYWSPYFDIFVSFILLIFSKQNIELISSFIPPVLGAFTLIPLYLLAKTLFNKRIALFTVLLFTFSYESIFISSFAEIDHHVAEVFCMLWFWFFFIKAFKHPADKWGIFSGIALGLCILMQIAGVVYVGIFLLYFIIHYIYLYLRKQEINTLIKVSLQTTISAALLVFPACITSYAGSHLAIKYDNLSLFQFLVLFSIFIFVLFIDGFDRLTNHGLNKYFKKEENRQSKLSCQNIGTKEHEIATPSARNDRVHFQGKEILILIFIGIIFIIMVYMILQPILGGMELIILKTGKTLYQTVAELKPTQILDFKYITGSFSILFYITPLILGFLLHKTIKENSPTLFFFFIWTIFIELMTLSSTRFSFLFTINMNILIGFSFFVIKDIIEKRIKILTFPVLLILFIITVYPMLTATLEYPKKYHWMKPSIYRAMKWLKNNTPCTSYYYQPLIPPEYRILAQWDMGFPMVYLAQRPVVADGYFSDNIGNTAIPSQFMFTDKEKEAESIIKTYNVKYIMLNDIIPALKYHLNITGKKIEDALFQGELHPGFNTEKADIYMAYPWFINTMYAKLFLHDGTRIGKTKELNHYRLVYESGEKIPYYILNSLESTYAYMLYYNLIFPIPADQFYILKPPGGEVKIFEYVKGAKIKGNTSPNTEVTAMIKVITNQQRKFDFITKTISNNNGSYELIIPYSTERGIIMSNNIKKYIKVSGDAVINGKTIYPDLL